MIEETPKAQMIITHEPMMMEDTARETEEHTP